MWKSDSPAANAREAAAHNASAIPAGFRIVLSSGVRSDGLYCSDDQLFLEYSQDEGMNARLNWRRISFTNFRGWIRDSRKNIITDRREPAQRPAAHHLEPTESRTRLAAVPN